MAYRTGRGACVSLTSSHSMFIVATSGGTSTIPRQIRRKDADISLAISLQKRMPLNLRKYDGNMTEIFHTRKTPAVPTDSSALSKYSTLYTLTQTGICL